MGLFGNQKNQDSAAQSSQAGSAGSAQVASGQASRGEGDEMANIGKSITIRGDVTGNEDLVIEGTVDGKVELPDNQLTIGASGTVRAEINAKSVVVIGKAMGNIHGIERVEIQATGAVEGDVSAPRLIVAEGAILNGAIEMGGKAAKTPAKVEPTKPTEARKAG